MNSIFQIISFLLTGFTMTLLFFDFFNEFFKKKYTNNTVYLFAYFVFFIAFLCSTLITTPIVRLFFPACLPFIFGVFLYSGFSFPLTLFLLISIELCEIIFEVLTKFIFYGKFEIMPNNILRNLVIFFMYQFLMMFARNRNQQMINLPKRKFSIFILPLFSLILINLSTYFTIQTPDYRLVTISSITAIGLLLANIFVFYLFQQIQTYAEKDTLYQMKNQQSQLQYQYVKDIENKNLEIKKILHDMKKHVAVLSALKNDKNSQNLVSTYLGQIENNLKEIEDADYTNSPIVNLLINEKKNVALNSDIKYSVTCENLSFNFMEEIDQTVLFSNILENAFEETMADTKEDKFVSITICKINDFKVVNVSNSFDPNQKKSRQGHMGLGLQNVKDVAEKYQAELTISANEKRGVFEIQILFFE